jgi:ribosome biogenesis protein YTM1
MINKALELAKVLPFDFMIRGGLLRGSLGDWRRENDVGEVCL